MLTVKQANAALFILAGYIHINLFSDHFTQKAVILNPASAHFCLHESD